MKKIEAFIRHEAFEPIRAELLERGFPSLSIVEAKGSVDPAVADQLLGKIEEISKIFWETKQA